MSLSARTWHDRRGSQRVKLSSSIRLEWLTAGGDLLSTRGATFDISSAGIYCFTENPLAIDLEVEFDIPFSAGLTGAEPLMFRCRGRVLRTEKLQSGFGIAVLIQSRHLIEAGELHRRGNVRVPATVVAEYSGLRATVRDLSLSGAFIEDYNPLSVGCEIEPHLKGQELRGEIVVTAVVRRIEPQVGMAVEFVALSADAERRLRESLERYTRSK